MLLKQQMDHIMNLMKAISGLREDEESPKSKETKA
jgi:hypothetical protein